MKITQKTYWSTTSIVVTLFVVALIVGVAAFIYYHDKGVAYVSVCLLAILAVICASALFFMPTSVLLDDKALTVMFPCRSKSFPLSEIADAVPFGDAKKMWRICGSGAFFGWWGWFSAKGVGKFMMYASNLDQLLLIRLSSCKKYVISCGDAKRIISALQGEK